MSSILKKELKQGTIADRGKKKIVIVLDKQCSESSGCKTGCGACGGNDKIQKAIIFTDTAENYAVGQKVQISRVSLNETLNALVVFGIPVFFALFCIGIWSIISPATVDSPLALLATAVSFLFGFVVVWCIDYLFHKKYPTSITNSLKHSFEGGTN